MTNLGARVLAAARGGAHFETPCFVYSAEVAKQNYVDLRDQLGTKLVLSAKANSNPELLSLILGVLEDGGIEVASYRELNTVAGMVGIERYLNSPASSENLMRSAVSAGATIILDNPAQVEVAVMLSKSMPLKPVMLRVNISSVPTLTTGAPLVRADHFGMVWRDVIQQALLLRAAGVGVAGFHLFAGSNSFRALHGHVAAAAARMIDELEAASGEALQCVNLGGGFGADFRKDEAIFSAYREALAQLPEHVRLLHEAGRAIFASAGAFLCRVLAKKTIDDRRYFVCDGGIAHDFLLCGTENPLSRRPSPIFDGPRSEPGAGGIVVGNSCSKDDVIGHIAPGCGEPDLGDLLIFENCGAYHGSYPNLRFLGLAPAETFLLS
jgi:diaminopimelate decarboxylase